MAAEAPDPKSLADWQDAFQSPVPVVRRMEQQLRADLSTNKEKLRSLVGASYRELLGTAERIIEMDEEMQQVEANLGRISEGCKSRLLERTRENYGRWDGSTREQDKERFTFASLLALLQNCPLIISRLLRKGGSILLAAKILVISRRIHRALSQHEPVPPLASDIRGQLASLWRKLLRSIDRQFSNPEASTSRLVELMCAFSLATSSSLTDVLKHFQHVRLECIAAQFEGNHRDHARVLDALRLYSRTLQDTQAVLPNPIIENLVKLKSHPLFKDGEVRAVVELSLDVHERWIPDSIRHFTPWIGHEDLQKSDADKILRAWAKKAFSTVLEGLQRLLTGMEDFRGLVRLRTEIYTTWFDGRNRVAGFDSSGPLQGLRSAINEQLVQLVRERARRLHLVGTEVEAALEDWKDGITDEQQGLWELAGGSMNIADGAVGFRSAVLDRARGRNNAVGRVKGSYITWLRLVEEISTILKELREQKWDEDLDDEEDEFGLESRNAQLSEDDPELLENELRESLAASFAELQNAIEECSKKISEGDRGGKQAMFLLRVLRELRQNLPKGCDVASFGLSLVPSLHAVVAETASSRPLQAFASGFDRRFHHQRQSRALWEGSPPLPVQPSPGVFKLLHGLASSMADGPDIWSTDAAAALKDVASRRVTSDVERTLKSRTGNGLVNGVNHVTASRADYGQANGSVNGSVNGDTEDDEGSAEEDRTTQVLYDVALLQKVFSSRSPFTQRSDETDDLKQSLLSSLKLGESSKERLQKSVAEYWKRTQLLFALLT
ncbi:MAG: hypothetical protein M1832_003084 [Thelocarpon impressellum]|nr:MAG: hypothetical protein M1832_003084 [Thelocarpon impressellum]